ncbi:MAG: LPS export ABC transporter periplasmic protein LptC [Roseococcus sp.]|nr:LPS export ABC transporter periplasmic protein LptC [Roseococcus sp.]
MSERVIRADFATPPEERRRRLAPSRGRRAPSQREIARRRLMVRAAKLAMPLLAAALFALLLFWPDIEGREGRLSFRRGPTLAPETLQVTEARYQGADEQNRPYTVTARLARLLREEREREVVLLEDPRADMLLDDGAAWVYAESRRGRYDRAAQSLELQGDVTIFHDNGTMFRTEEAEVDIAGGSARGDRPTLAQGSFGVIRAEGFEMRERGAVLVFTGRSHAVLEGRQR